VSGATRAHARFEADGVGEHEVGAAHRLAFGEREQGGEDRRACMKDNAAHVGIVEIEDVPHLAIGERCVEEPEAQVAAENTGLRPPAGLLENGDELVDRRMAAAGERTADPVEHAATGLVRGSRRDVVELGLGEVAAQRLGQGDGSGVEVLVHGGDHLKGFEGASGGAVPAQRRPAQPL
jgi:hypothetical protein